MTKGNDKSEVAVIQPEVNSSLKFDLNQNDLVDIVLEEQLEKLEVKIDAIEDETKAIDETLEGLREPARKYVLKQAKKDKDYKNLLKVVKLLGLEVPEINIHTPCHSKTVETFNYYFLDTQSLNNIKDPTRVLKSRTHETSKTLSLTKVYSANCKIGTSNLDVTWGINVEIPKSITDVYIKEGTILVKRFVKLKKKLLELELDYYKLKHGSKRFKAKLMKQALKSSAEGRGIIDLLDAATDTKMLK